MSTPTDAVAAEATYEVLFEDLWNATDHPLNYPNGAHFSTVVGAVHNAGVSFWAAGELATLGVENVAETGSTRNIQREIFNAQQAGSAIERHTGSNPTINVSDDFPLVTFLTMVAPTPDWFVGIHDVDLRDPSGPGFVESQVFEFTSFYDAGTEEGTAFSLNNPASDPHEPITRVGGRDAVSVFVTDTPSRGQLIPPIARLTFTRVSQTIPEPSSLLLAGLMSLVTVANARTRRRVA
ncbi:MAG: spondin domain-containing protein [Lacipirellulaceae bacterium]